VSDQVRQDFGWLLDGGDFVTDKTGVRTIELTGVSFLAEEESLFGEPNEDWHARELEWYRSMSRNVRDITPPVPKIWESVADVFGNINSNYGWCVWSDENGRQFENVYKELKRNPESRRAVMIYTRPSMWYDYSFNGRSDFMCTNAVQYLIRDGYLYAVVQMRSNDAVFGYKGDRAWQNTVLTELGYELGVLPGGITWQVGSLHVYERHFYLVDHWYKTGETTIKKADYNALYPESPYAG
jgi:thymidylate synthase